MYGAKGDAMHCPATGLPASRAVAGFDLTYPQDLERALGALWQGALAAPRASEGGSR
jgi:hypothetical protein